MKLPAFFSKRKKKSEGGFAEFFLHASEKEKKEVFMDAARKANEDQRSLVENINRLEHKIT